MLKSLITFCLPLLIKSKLKNILNSKILLVESYGEEKRNNFQKEININKVKIAQLNHMLWQQKRFREIIYLNIKKTF